MRSGSEATGVEIPPHVLHRDAELVNACLEFVVVRLTLAATDDFTNAREEHVHGTYGLAVVVLLHVERFDFLRVVGENDRTTEVLFDEESFMFALEVSAPRDGEFELHAIGLRLLKNLDALGIGDAGEILSHDALESCDEFVVPMVVEETEVILTVVKGVADEVFEEILGEVHVVVDIVERHFGFDHPEFGKVARRVALLGTEGRSEGVDLSDGQCAKFAFQLSGDGESGGFAKEVLRVVDFAIIGLRRVGEVERSDLKHLSSPFGIAAGDERRVEVEEATIVEELVDGESHVVTHAEDGTEGVGARAEVSDGAQVFERVSFLLQRVFERVRLAIDGDVGGLDFDGLPFALALDEVADGTDAGTRGDALDERLVKAREVNDYLYGVDGAAVVECDEVDVLVAASGTNPTFDVDDLVFAFGRECVGDACPSDIFHNGKCVKKSVRKVKKNIQKKLRASDLFRCPPRVLWYVLMKVCRVDVLLLVAEACHSATEADVAGGLALVEVATL